MPNDIVFDGGSSRFDGVATGHDGGAVRVAGDVGAQAGRAMRGGQLVVEGDAGPHAGSGMRGGRLEILGNAGDHLGAPLAGELAGMNGGVLIVRGKAGAFAADRMRRGLIAVLKGCGDHAGSRMIAGTLVVAGGAGEMPGYLMRRGSILLDRAPEKPVAELRRMRRAGERLRRPHRPPPDRGRHPQAAAARQGAAQIWRRQCGVRHGRDSVSGLRKMQINPTRRGIVKGLASFG